MTSDATTRFSSAKLEAGWTYNLNRMRVNTMLIDSGYQMDMSVVNGMHATQLEYPDRRGAGSHTDTRFRA